MAGVSGAETIEAAGDDDDDSRNNGVMRNRKYNNWVKSAEGLVLLQQGLAPFVDREVYNKHTQFLKKVSSCVQGPNRCGCTFKNILPDHSISRCNLQKCLCKEKPKGRRPCPHNYCSTFCQMILNEHKTGDPLWRNTDMNAWPTDHWSIAKCYMTTQTSSSSAQMTDASGLLSVIINGKFFQSKVSSQLGQPGDVFLKARDLRNAIFHRPKIELTDIELQDILDTFVAVLQDPLSLLYDQDARLAVTKLESLRNNVLKITSEEEREILYRRTEALKQMIQEVEEAKSEAVKSVEAGKKQAVDDISRLNEETLQKLQETKSELLESVDARTKILYQRAEAQKNMIQGVEEAKSEAVKSVEAKKKQAVDDISRLKEETLQKLQETKSGVLESVDAKTNTAAEKLNQLLEMMQKVKVTDSEAVKCDATLQRQNDEIRERLRIIETEIQVIVACKVLDRVGRGIPDTEQEALNAKLPVIQRQLANYLWKHYTTTSLCPLKIRENDVRIDEVYTEPNMEIDQNTTGRDKDKTTNQLKLDMNSDIFKIRGTRLRRIYVLGEVGTGKTTFCQMLMSEWCKFILKDSQNNTELLQEVKQYDFVFYLPLKMLQNNGNLREMITWYYKNEVPEEIVDYILSKSPEKCLILADGLDEWKPSSSERRRVHVTYGIPDAEDMKDVTLVTTSRPSAPGVLNMRSTEYDRKIIISGIKGVYTMAQKYCAKMPAERQTDVLQRLYDLNVRDIERMPLILKQIVWMLGNGYDITPGIGGLYSDFVRIAMKWCYDKYKQELEETNTFELSSSRFSKLKLPEQLGDLPFQNLAFSLSQIAFEMYIMESNQMLGRKKLREYGVNDDQIKCLLGVGLLSEENIENPMEEDTQFCFPHTSFMEYFSAVFIVSNVQSDQTSTGGAECHPDSIDPLHRLFMTCRTVKDVFALKTVLKFVCGLAPSWTKYVCQNIYNKAQSDKQYFKDILILDSCDSIHVDVQRLIADFVTECKVSYSLQIPILALTVHDDSYLDIHCHVEGQSVQHLLLDQSKVDRYKTSAFPVDCSQFKHLNTLTYAGNYLLDSAENASSEKQFILQNLQMSELEILLMTRQIIPTTLTGVKCENLKKIAINDISLRLHSEVSSLLNFISYATALCSLTICKLSCLQHRRECNNVIDFSRHDKIQVLYLRDTPKIHIKGINNSELKHVYLHWCLMEKFRNLRNSRKLNNLTLDTLLNSTGSPILSRDFTKEMNEVLCTCTQLQYLRFASLHIQDDALQVHSSMENLSRIELQYVSMSESTFIKFAESLLTLRQSVEVRLDLLDQCLLERFWSYIRNIEYVRVTAHKSIIGLLCFETLK